jgi:uncharacterized protein
MPFIVIGYDGDDEQALARRLAVREQHIKLGDTFREQGKVLYGLVFLIKIIR